jgi:hypothetical protein
MLKTDLAHDDVNDLFWQDWMGGHLVLQNTYT